MKRLLHLADHAARGGLALGLGVFVACSSGSTGTSPGDERGTGDERSAGGDQQSAGDARSGGDQRAGADSASPGDDTLPGDLVGGDTMIAGLCPPSPPYGTAEGSIVPSLVLNDCDGNPHDLHDLCQRKAGWFFIYAGY